MKATANITPGIAYPVIENVEIIKVHFKWVLANDFYKDELSAEQIAEMESYLPSDYQDEYEDLPE